MSAPAVTLEAVVKRFPDAPHPAIDRLSASLPAGAVTGLVGPDGAGKTTLLRLIAGLLLPSAGRIRVLGYDPVSEPGPIHARIGYMPQQFGLYEDLTVLENLRLYADLRGLAGRARADSFERLLAFTDLAAFTARRAGALSGGMKQKLGLACALLKAPRLLLLDEPSVGVDPISRRELWRMVAELAGEGVSVLWSTAYLDEAERCDHVIVLDGGRCLFAGPPADLTRRVEGRCLELGGLRAPPRRVLARALDREDVLDGVVQGSAVRLLLAEGRTPSSPDALGAPADARMRTVRPRFEDGVIDALGGGPGGRSPLAEAMAPVPPADEAVVSAQGLTKRFGEFTAADRISFAVGRGEVFGLLGPNGAGKSTTFKMMCGLLAPSAGDARIGGLVLASAGGRARTRIGYMAQKFSLYGSLSVRQNLAFFAGVYGLAGGRRRRAIARMIDIFHFEDLLDREAGGLPLGFKQRLALACAVMHRPDVLFLDEPTSGVDPITRREFWTHINGLAEKGVTMVVTTHFMEEAEYCDRIALIHRGRQIATGTPDALKAQVARPERPDPSMEDAFVALVEAAGEQAEHAA